MIDRLAQIFSAIIPPAEATAKALARWRVTVALMLMAGIVYGIWGVGWVPGVPGFAMARELQEQRTLVQQVSDGQNAILIRLIRADIESSRVQQCRALQAGNREAADGWATSLRTALAEYLSLAGREYQLRECSEY